MHTNRLFRENVYLRECDASIRSVSTREDKVLITLDQTIFFPTGGGQSCDLGTINDFAVVDVYEYEDDIFHCVACAPDALRVGDSVHLTLDWARRFDNMQRHCGEHILSGMFYREYGGVNRGFHMGDNYMTVDISLEENPDFKTLTWEMAKHAELCTNEAIWSNAPVITRHFDTKQEAEHLPLRTPSKRTSPSSASVTLKILLTVSRAAVRILPPPDRSACSKFLRLNRTKGCFAFILRPADAPSSSIRRRWMFSPRFAIS